jgi:hypothetical protein
VKAGWIRRVFKRERGVKGVGTTHLSGVKVVLSVEAGVPLIDQRIHTKAKQDLNLPERRTQLSAQP